MSRRLSAIEYTFRRWSHGWGAFLDPLSIAQRRDSSKTNWGAWTGGSFGNSREWVVWRQQKKIMHRFEPFAAYEVGISRRAVLRRRCAKQESHTRDLETPQEKSNYHRHYTQHARGLDACRLGRNNEIGKVDCQRWCSISPEKQRIRLQTQAA